MFTYSAGWSTFSNGLVAGRCRASSAEYQVYNQYAGVQIQTVFVSKFIVRRFRMRICQTTAQSSMLSWRDLTVGTFVRILRDFSVGFVMTCRVAACLGSGTSTELVTA